MPDEIQNAPSQEDLLETLLAGAAQKAAEAEAQKVLAKGTVTKSEFGTALTEFESRLLEKVSTVLDEKLQKSAPAPEPENEPDQNVSKSQNMTGGRKGTMVGGGLSPREDNPVRYLVQKARETNPVYDQTDKQLMWALTFKGLTLGMSNESLDGADFGDEYGE